MPAADSSNEKGRQGENIAAVFLQEKGYKIIQRNFRVRLGEIDIIAADKKYVVFAEVKFRKNNHFAEGREFVTRKKQQRIIAAAMLWLSNNRSSLQPRFDVIEIYAPTAGQTNLTINHIPDAFGA